MPPIGAHRRIDGMTGEVWLDIGGALAFAADVTEVTGTISIEKKDVPIPGTRDTQNKPGRVGRSGSMRYQKIDDRYELYFLAQLQDLAALRILRDANGGNLPNVSFTTQVNLDDPQAWGASILVLTGCKMWELPIGFNINDLVEREIPITWERETSPPGGSINRSNFTS